MHEAAPEVLAALICDLGPEEVQIGEHGGSCELFKASITHGTCVQAQPLQACESGQGGRAAIRHSCSGPQ